MNHKISDGLTRIRISQNGYTLVEAIIAITVCGFGLAMILGLYGMAIKTEMVSKTIFEQSIEINSIADDLRLTLTNESLEDFSESINSVLNNKYPDYLLTEIKPESQANLYHLKILHKGHNSLDKEFIIKLFWRQDEIPGA